MRDYMSLGPVPYEEDCVQVNPDTDYIPAMRAEVNKFKVMLEERFLDIPEEAYFGVKREQHDFGTYLEVAVYWDTDDEDSRNFAFFVESNIPAKWSDDKKIYWRDSQKIPAGWDVID